MSLAVKMGVSMVSMIFFDSLWLSKMFYLQKGWNLHVVQRHSHPPHSDNSDDGPEEDCLGTEKMHL